MIAAHPRLISYPETHFWDYTIPDKFRYRFLKIYSAPEKALVRAYLDEHEFPLDAMSDMKSRYLTTRSWSRALMRILDRLTDPELSGWIEKTPRHLYAIPYITGADKDALFLHILRSGKDVVASMYEVTHKYPEYWNGPRTIDMCLERWKRDVELSKKYLTHPRHFFISYEELLEYKEKILEKVCEFLGVSFSLEMIDSFMSEAQKLVGEKEKWKAANISGRSPGSKFSSIFSSNEQEYILSEIGNISLESFRINTGR
jgi:hypothetical protein